MLENPAFAWLARLMCYPDADLKAALPEFRAMLDTEPLLSAQVSRVDPFLAYLEQTPLITLQENYVRTFDTNRSHALYLFEHVYGEDRDRGSAMVDLLDEYRQNGFILCDDELPDYLPVVLEYMASSPIDKAMKTLGDAVHVIAHIQKKLEGDGSPYGALMAACVAMSPVKPLPLVEPPVRDMDEAMETFGPDVTGVEPLLKPDSQIIKFFPNATRSASTGASS